jgi:hypothetical protein
MAGKKLPAEDHVLRYAGNARLLKAANEDDEFVVIGIDRDAYRRRETEKALSVTWAEYFVGSWQQQIEEAAQAFRRTYTSAAKKPFKGAFGIGRVDAIDAMCRKHGHQVRILHERVDGNEGHAGIHRIPRDNDDLLDDLADNVFDTFVLNSDIPEA